MPGPGGGSRGGGGGRSGGFSSGGFSGGGFGGGPRGGGFGGGPGGFGRGPRRPYGWHHRPFFWYHRPYGYGYGGGCLGAIMAPVVLVIFALFFIISSFGSAVDVVVEGGEIYYDENTFQDYANEQYGIEFGGKGAYEDNLLIVFLVDDVEYYDYAYIAWVGDHINTDVNMLFGAQNTELGRAMSSYVNERSYKYSLDSNLAMVMTRMKDQIVNMQLDSSFMCEEDQGEFKSHLTNKTDLQLSADTVDAALQSFTAETGIPAVIVVDTIENVYGRTVTGDKIITLLIAAVLIIIAVVLIVKAIKGSKNQGKQNSNRYSQNQGSQNNSSQSNGSGGTYW